MAALLSVPLLGAVGLGIDITMARTDRAELTRALDAAVLAGARMLPSGADAAVATAHNFFVGNYPHLLDDHGHVNPKNPEFEVRDGAVHGTARLHVPTTFMSILGIDMVDVTGSSAATSSGGGMELVMVLDVSGSMGGKGKIEALRTASVSLLDTLYGENASLPNTYVGIAPFSGRVNISTYENGWIDPDHPNSGSQAGGNENDQGNGKGKGKDKGKGKADDGDDIVAGCTGLRSDANQQSDAPPSVELFAPFTGPAKVCPGPLAIGLTTQKDVIRNALFALYTGDGTSTQESMGWGYRMISPRWKGLWGSPDLPLDHDETPRKIVVIMTDGSNHPNQSDDPFDTATADEMLLESCTLMKADGIIIYSVAFDMKGALASLYRQCASEPEYHYDAESSSDLIAAFDAIGSEINKGALRLIY